MARGLFALALLPTVAFGAAIWPVAGWNDAPTRPVNLCNQANVPTETQCKAATCCVKTSKEGADELRQAINNAKALKSTSCPKPIVWTKYDADFDKADKADRVLVIDFPMVLYLANTARLTAPRPKNWPCSKKDGKKGNAPPFISVEADGVAFCGSGNGKSDNGGRIAGTNHDNRADWYPDNGKCGNSFEWPDDSDCEEGAPDLVHVGIITEAPISTDLVKGFAMVGISLLNSPRYTFVPSGVNGIFIWKLWLTADLPGSLIGGSDVGDETCNVDGLHFNQVTGAIIDSSTVQTGDDGIVMAWGNSYISVTNVNLFNGHGTTVGQTGLESSRIYCNRFIAYQHITGISQRWSLRIKAPMQESYAVHNILYNDYCSLGAEQTVSVNTEESSQNCTGSTTLRVNVTDFIMYTPGSEGDLCPDRLNPNTNLGLDAATSIWTYPSKFKKSSIECKSIPDWKQTVDCGFWVKNFKCEATNGGAQCQEAEACADNDSLAIRFSGDVSDKKVFSQCTNTNIPTINPNQNKCAWSSTQWGNRNPDQCNKKKDDEENDLLAVNSVSSPKSPATPSAPVSAALRNSNAKSSSVTGVLQP